MRAASLAAAVVVAPVLLGAPHVSGQQGVDAAAVTAPALELRHYTLDNGLEVILHRDPAVTSVVVHVRYHVGSKDEVAGKTGFAHLFEHLMFEGSAHVGEGEFDTLLEAAGGWNNGTTDNDRTNYFEQVPASFLPLALWLEADRMAGLWDAMNQGVLDNQREVVKNERRQSYENQPYGLAALAVQQALWPAGHGNHNLTIGTMEDLTAASLDDVEAFWRTYYRPSNATLVIAGGIELDAAAALVDTYFAWMPKQDVPPRVTLTAPVEPRAGAVDLETTDRVHAPAVLMAWRTDAAYTPGAMDLAVAAQLLGGGKTSRLYRRLVFTDRLATEVDVRQNDLLLGGELTIDAVARDGVAIEEVRDAIRDELAALREAAPSDAEVERARRVMEASRLGGLESLASRADALASWAAYTGDPDHLAEELELLRAVTAASLHASVKRWLATDAGVTMIVRPEKET